MYYSKSNSKQLVAALICFAAAATIGLVMLTGVEGVLSRWILFYKRTPPIATTILALFAAWGMYRNPQDRARFLMIGSLLLCATIYAIAQWNPPWWIIYGDSLLLSAMNTMLTCILSLSIYRGGSR